MMNKAITIPVIDLFAGPGGLGEGFNMAECSDKNSCFKVYLAVEKDPMAHKTLKLRSFSVSLTVIIFRQSIIRSSGEIFYRKSCILNLKKKLEELRMKPRM